MYGIVEKVSDILILGRKSSAFAQSNYMDWTKKIAPIF